MVILLTGLTPKIYYVPEPLKSCPYTRVYTKQLLEMSGLWYRHNSCMAFLVARMVQKKPRKMRVLADLPGWKENGGTVPHSMAMTGRLAGAQHCD